jgi:hypothetical protein
MCRLVVVLVWLVAVAAVVVAIGLRVQARRLADPVQTLSVYLMEVPPEVARFATVVGRDKGMLQVELRANHKWVRIFVERNRFTPIEGALSGFAAERWILTDSKKRGAVVHVLLPQGGGPALLTIAQ